MNSLLIKVFISLVFVSSSLTANEMKKNSNYNEAWYIGLGTSVIGSGTHKNTVESTSSTKNNTKIDSKLRTLKVGYNDNGFRAEIAYTSNVITNNNNKQDKGYFKGLDFDIAQTLGEDKLKPFVTLGMGIHFWDKVKIGVADSTQTRNRKAFSLNYGAGVLYKFKIIELELAYKGKYYMWESLFNQDKTQETKSNTIVHGLYLGANFRF